MIKIILPTTILILFLINTFNLSQPKETSLRTKKPSEADLLRYEICPRSKHTTNEDLIHFCRGVN